MSTENEDRGDVITDGDEVGDTTDLNKDAAASDVAKDEPGKTEDAASKDAAKEEPEGKKEPMIPKTRFDQAVAKARAAEKAERERADKLEQDLKARTGQIDAEKIEAEIDKLEEKLEGAIADGNAELKTQLRREIRAKMGALSDAKAQAHAAYATAVAIEQVRYDAVVERMEVEHPELNPDNEETYDETVVAEIMEYKVAFEAAGKSSTEALKKALKAVYGAGKPKEPEPDPKKDDEPAPDKKAAAEAKAAERKEAAVKAAIDTKAKQPADMKKAGMDSDKAGKATGATSVIGMSDKDFDKLTPEELAKLRGDAG